jgi:FemAB-related protein (PEP-CTERM system-associated)
MELRHEREFTHPRLTQSQTSKVQMRLPLPDSASALWDALKPKVRNQIRKGESHGLTVSWGGIELLEPFYGVFARNMRDLGTPCYGRNLFKEILLAFPADAELCVVRYQSRPVAAAILDHDAGITRVPSASSLRCFNWTNANMFMYWRLLERAIGRGQHTFDFGRSTIDGNTYRFKKQWGATPHPSVWQYYLRRGGVSDVRPDNAKYRFAIRAWQCLPVWLTRCIGPAIVRGIP